jgi:hypothetical protein
MKPLACIITAIVTTFASAAPVSTPAIDLDKGLKCLNQIRLILVGCQRFAQDHNGHYPANLKEIFPDYYPDVAKFVCPFSGSNAPLEYEYFGGDTTDAPTKVLLRCKHTTPTLALRAVAYNGGWAQLECTPDTEAKVTALLAKGISRAEVVRLFGAPTAEYSYTFKKVLIYLLPNAREPRDAKVSFSGFEALLDSDQDKLTGWRAIFRDGRER